MAVFHSRRAGLQLRFCFFFLQFLIFCPSSGQGLVLKHFTVDEGLPSNEVYQMTEDLLGNLLIATDRGAARFDGYRIEPLGLRDEKTSLPVYYIYRSPKGPIYFSGQSGFIYEYYNDCLNPHPQTAKVAAQYRHAGILIANTIALQHDSLWISYNNDYLFNLELGTSLILPDGTIQKWEKPEGLYFDLQHQFYYREFKNLFSSNREQTLQITWEDGSESRETIHLNWPDRYVRRLFALREGPYHFFSVGRKVLVYHLQKKVAEYFFSHNILAFERLDASTLGLGLEGGGVRLYDISGGKLVKPKESYLHDLSVSGIHRDKQGGIWFSTLENGIFYAHPAGARSFEKSEKIVSIQKWRDSVLVGYATGKAELYSEGRLCRTLTVPLGQNETLLRFSVQLSGALIAISSRGHYFAYSAGWSYHPELVYSVLPISDKLVYGMGMNTPAFQVYKGPGGKKEKSVYLPKRIRTAFKDEKNRIWLGTLEGLFLFENDSLLDYTREHAAFTDRIVGIDQLPGGWLAVATLGKGLVLKKEEKTFHLTKENGLTSPIINSLQVDSNTVYLGTNMGITAVTLREEGPVVQHYGAESGLPSLDIHQFTVNNGWLYVKWVNKLVSFSLVRFQQKITPPSIYLTAVTINGKPVDPHLRGQFNHLQNAAIFAFNSINLASATGQTYSYQLEGFETTLHHSKERVANYTNLPPGDYTFKVRTKGIDNQSTAFHTYSFTIHPGFWQRPAFPVLIGACLLGLSYLFFRKRLRISKEKARLKLALAESNQRALIQLINPHFISNLLNTVHAAILKQQKIEAASVISRFAKLMRLAMEMGKEKYIPLTREVDLLNEYMALEKLRSPQKFNYCLQLDPALPQRKVRIPGMLIQPFVENAIKHGVMHMEEKGYIHISLAMSGKALLCEVSDNGIGCQQAARINANKPGNHHSSGVAITLNRLMLLHKEQGTTSLYEVEDLCPGAQKYPGTLVRFSIPFHLYP